MGQEVVCTARWGGKSVRGKALLETAEIIFRGGERRKIPFSAIRGMEAKDGELRLRTDEGLVVFELGERAEKWRGGMWDPRAGGGGGGGGRGGAGGGGWEGCWGGVEEMGGVRVAR